MHVEFVFHNVYEVKYNGQLFSKLYDEHFTDEELEVVSENIGNKVLEKIEKNINVNEKPKQFVPAFHLHISLKSYIIIPLPASQLQPIYPACVN